MYTNLNYILGEEFANAIENEDEKAICSKILGLETLDDFSDLKPFEVLAAIHEICAIKTGIINLRNMWEWDIHQTTPNPVSSEKMEAVIRYNKHAESLSTAHSILMHVYDEVQKEK